ncbi:UNVERIFIED_CONTAM: putative protein phosphatase 2C 43 [Sesamum calycinum]|uniref:protein-serine/threonine phosphatase n=1 Tax=Sesamum calycinum TaxID=2727403 RepID=A0AAW2N6C9_9LAMI
MCSWLGRTVSSCFRPLSQYARMSKDDCEGLGSEDDVFLWSRDLEKHSHGEFSFAVVQANQVLEDQSQVETGRHATFVGVYDGHGLARENGIMSEDILRNALSETETGFLTLVRRAYEIRPVIAAIGSCCLVGIIWKRTLYIANLGDSRAVIGYLDQSKKIIAEQLTKDHNASMEEVRKELKALHPEDSQILVMKQGVWRIKGIIQVSRSIGDAYLKRPEFALDPSFPRFHLPEPIRQPVLRSDPAICTRDLEANDKFSFLHLMGIARRLVVVSAMVKAAKTRQIPYNEMKKLDSGVRRHVHDDITVVVVYIDHGMLDDKNSTPELSVRGFVDTAGPSNFNFS